MLKKCILQDRVVQQVFQLSDPGQMSLSRGGGVPSLATSAKVAFPPPSYYPVIFPLSTNHSQCFVSYSLKYLLKD